MAGRDRASTENAGATPTIEIRIPMTTEELVSLHLRRLANEKVRIGQQIEMWSSKQARLRARLIRIERQMEELREICPSATVGHQIEDAEEAGYGHSLEC